MDRSDPTQPYRCFVKDESEKRQNQFIDLFFYDGAVSRECLRRPLEEWQYLLRPVERRPAQVTKKRPQLIHIATDGETYSSQKIW
jgi:hypothetical protein